MSDKKVWHPLFDDMQSKKEAFIDAARNFYRQPKNSLGDCPAVMKSAFLKFTDAERGWFAAMAAGAKTEVSQAEAKRIKKSLTPETNVLKAGHA